MRSLAVSLVLVAPLALAQPNSSTSRSAPEAQADATGARPGDEALTCEQLQAELATASNDPGLQALLGQARAMAGANAQTLARHPDPTGRQAQALAQLNAAATGNADTATQATVATNAGADEQSQQPPKEDTAKRRGLGGLGKGLGAAFGIAPRVNAKEAERQAAENRKEIEAAQKQNPQMMRGMHLLQIADAKGCSKAPEAAK